VAFIGMTVVVFVVLLGLSLGWLPPLMVPNRHVWLVYPCTQLYLHLAQSGLGPLIGASADPHVDTTLSKQMFALFGCLLLQALSFKALCVCGPKAAHVRVLHAPTCIFSIAFTYYAYAAYGTPLVVEVDWTGARFHPLHCVMWMASTSVQCVLWTQIYYRQCVTTGPFPLPAKAMLYAMSMLWTGLLGHLDFTGTLGAGAIALNLALNCLCFVLLYALMFEATYPLHLAEQFYRRLSQKMGSCADRASPDTDEIEGSTSELAAKLAGMRRLETHFRWAKRYVWASWHGFPLTWALGASGLVDGRTRESLYSVCDAFAKFLPVSLYLSMLDTRY